jgi:hypothetical protein
VGAGSLSDGAVAFCADVAELGEDTAVTGGDTAEFGVGVGSLGDGADPFGGDAAPLAEDADATAGAAALGAGVGSLAEAADAFRGEVAPLAKDVDETGPAMAQPGVGAGSASEGAEASTLLAADGSAKATGREDSGAKATAPSAIAESRRTL